MGAAVSVSYGGGGSGDLGEECDDVSSESEELRCASCGGVSIGITREGLWVRAKEVCDELVVWMDSRSKAVGEICLDVFVDVVESSGTLGFDIAVIEFGVKSSN